MTREEAIERIKDHMLVHKMNEPRAIKISEALEMVIQALEQEPCEDAISRQAVIDCFKKWQPYMATRLHEFEKELFDLPSVQPMRKRDDVDKIKDLLDAIKAIAGNLEDLKDYENIEELCNDIEKVVTK